MQGCQISFYLCRQPHSELQYFVTTQGTVSIIESRGRGLFVSLFAGASHVHGDRDGGWEWVGGAQYTRLVVARRKRIA